MTQETINLIIEWFAHIEQMATDRKTQTGAVMDRQHCLDEIAVLASECKQFVEEYQHEQEPINEEELDRMAEYYLYGENNRYFSPREVYEMASPQDKDVWDAYKAGRKEVVV